MATERQLLLPWRVRGDRSGRRLTGSMQSSALEIATGRNGSRLCENSARADNDRTSTSQIALY